MEWFSLTGTAFEAELAHAARCLAVSVAKCAPLTLDGAWSGSASRPARHKLAELKQQVEQLQALWSAVNAAGHELDAAARHAGRLQIGAGVSL